MQPLELISRQQTGGTLSAWQAAGDFAGLLARYGSRLPALRHFGFLEWRAGRLDVAIEAFEAALTLAPENPDLWSDLAGVHNAALRRDQAEICVLHALRLEPNKAQSWLLLAALKTDGPDQEGAEAAFRRAADLDPGLADAHFGLGIKLFHRRRFAEAADSIRLAIAAGHDAADGHATLGHVLYMTGDFAACAEAFEAASALAPLDAGGRQKYARARTFHTIIEGNTQAALADYAGLAGPYQEDMADLLHDAFRTLSGLGHRGAAIEIGRIRLAQAPEDPVRRYLLDAVSARPISAAPADYLEAHFDSVAAGFDHTLVELLGYRVPQDLADLVRRHHASFSDILDIGCGTGLAAELLAGFGGRLTGIDLSAQMLAEAARRGRYAELAKADAALYLAAHPGRFDLIFAADVLIYLGDPQPALQSVLTALRPRGVFAFSIETAACERFCLLPSGRFAHSEAFLQALAAPDFELLDSVETVIRQEANSPVSGRLMVLRRRVPPGA